MTSAKLFPNTLWRIGWRHLIRSPWQSLLMILGIMLGVAVVIGVDMANESASRAFEISTDAVAGKATHFIAGGPNGLDENIFTDLKLDGFPYPAAPIISAYVTSEKLGDIPLQLLGIDSFSEAPFRSYLNAGGEIPVTDLSTFLTSPGAVLISTGLAERYDLSIGDELSLEISGRFSTATISGLLEPDDKLSQQALNGLILADIATVQELTGQIGTLEKIDLILPPDAAAVIGQLKAQLPIGVNVLPVEARSNTVEQMTAAFQTNLTALSLLALIVGLFLIYNTMTFSVVQRRGMFGTLRSLGVTRREIFLLVIGEAFLAGTVGGILGIFLGIFLGQGTVALISQTINDLFFTLTVQDVSLPWISLVKGGLLGIGVTVIAAAFPAWEAASVPPREALTRSTFESKVGKLIVWVGLAGGLSILLGGLVLLIPTRNLVISFGGTFLIVIGFALLTPIITRLVMKIIAPLLRLLWGPIGHMAPREVTTSISRTGIAIAALMIAVSVSIGVDLMVGSFRFTVETWMEQVLQGDVYISSPGATFSQTGTPIDALLIEEIRNWPGVKQADVLRSVVVDSPLGPIQVGANDSINMAQRIDPLDAIGTDAEVLAALENGAISISEPLASRLNIKGVGESLTLYTDRGPVDFPIAVIYYDYSSTQGSAIMRLDVYHSYWDDTEISAISLSLENGADPEQIAIELQDALTRKQQLFIRPNQTLRTETLKIFDRTFAITGALQILATLVAFIGVLSAMLSLQLEKQRQLGILRAIGLTVRQLWGLILLETGLMGAVAGLLAIPTGYVLSLILVYIINKRSFGWTLQTQFTAQPFIEALMVAIFAALLAGIYPAWRLSKRNPSDAIRFD